ncbi:Peroxidase 43 [Hordeum vulgare]|nr:Peroxidase 43 [Hordeum vulgare]
MGTASGAVALLLVVVLGASVSGSSGQLQVGFYSKSCPSAESTVASVVRGASAADSTILPALLRLQFHDCFVRGCDASVLIKGGNNNAEVDNGKHQGLRGMDVIENAKAQLESVCPGVVSCADVVVLAARDAVAFTGGPSFDVPTGRRDGKVSNLRDGDVLPDVHDSAQVLRSKFRASGLDDKDLVLLSSAHTVGTTACFFIQDRLYNFPLPGGGVGSDPSIPDGFLSELKSRCAPGTSTRACRWTAAASACSTPRSSATSATASPSSPPTPRSTTTRAPWTWWTLTRASSAPSSGPTSGRTSRTPW